MADKQMQGQERPMGRGEQQGQQRTQAAGASGQPERGMQRREREGTVTPARGHGGIGRSSPFGMMRRMMEDMDRLFEDFGFGGALGGRSGGMLAPFRESGMGSVFTPAIEVLEREGKLLVRADLPGLKKEDVRVNVDDDGLLIEGERRSEHEERREGYLHSERSYGSFQRRIPLPRGVDVSTCDASFDDGVLEVKIDLPKESRRKIDVRSRESGGESGGQSAGAGEAAPRNGPSTVRH
jgi:HSP20 family protein